MGKIKKILENELIRGTQSTDVYPVTSVKAVYDENNKRLDNIIKELDNKVSTQLPAIEEAKNKALNNIKENEQSAITNFNAQRVTPEMLSESTKQLIEASGGGTITNLADDEDITSVDDSTGSKVLKFADRTYNADNFSGKGYKILRKNVNQVSIAVTEIRVETIPSSDGTLSFIINGKETRVSVSVSTDTTTALVAQKIAAALNKTMTEYEVSVDDSLVTLTQKSNGSVAPSSYSSNDTGIICTINDNSNVKLENLLTSDMLNQPNTIYEVRYDFFTKRIDNANINITTGSIQLGNKAKLVNVKFTGNLSHITGFASGQIKNCKKAPLFDCYSQLFIYDTFELFLNRDITYTHNTNNPIYCLFTDTPIDKRIIVINGNGHSIVNENKHNNRDGFLFRDIRGLKVRNLILDGVNFISDIVNGHSEDSFILFENCYIKNTERFGLEKVKDAVFKNCIFENMEVGGSAINGRFIDCKFILGDYNSNNHEMLHFSITSPCGNLIVERCTFIDNREDVDDPSDWIDLYDNSNVVISRCNFFSKNKVLCSGEGIINIKSQSSSTKDAASTETDKNGSKYNVIISQNTFNFNNITSSVNEFIIFTYRTGLRTTSDKELGDVINFRHSLIVCDNTFHLKGNIQFSLLRILDAASDCNIHDNIIFGEGAVNVDNLMYIAFNKDDYDRQLGILPKCYNLKYHNNIINIEGNVLSLYKIYGDISCIKNLQLTDNIITCKNNTKRILGFSLKGTPFIIRNNIIDTEDDSGEYIAGNSSTRPELISIGSTYWDKTLNKLIIWNGTAWVNADGTELS